jgi:multidrug efflux pump subunit AcrA (membrane-fusion protein)
VKKWIYIGIGAVILIAILTFIFWPRSSSYEAHDVAPMTLKRTITVSGSVKAPEEIDLAFKSTGRIEDIGVKAGDFVEDDQYLMKLETREAENAIARNQASVSEAVARLRQLEAGITDEERALLQSRVDTAARNVEDVKQCETNYNFPDKNF